jgi:hypothetical protein
MASRDRQVDRAREALQEKQEEDRLRAERKDSQRRQEPPEPRPKRRPEGEKR